jgi:hypothetical protein
MALFCRANRAEHVGYRGWTGRHIAMFSHFNPKATLEASFMAANWGLGIKVVPG